MRMRRVLGGLAVLCGLSASPAGAFEFLDGRLELHGFYENQLRGIARDLDLTDDLDLTQWYHVLNLELDATLAPEGFGPFDLVSAFARVEARYDCVWTHACSLFGSADAYGRRSRFGRLPKRLADGRRSGFSGTMFHGDVRRYSDIAFVPGDPQAGPDGVRGTPDDAPVFGIGFAGPAGSFKPITILQNAAYTRQTDTSPGVDGVFGNADDPAPFVLRRFRDCMFGSQRTKGPGNGLGRRDLLLGIDGCDVLPIGSLRDRPNPFRPGDANPILRPPGALPSDPTPGGTGALPFRPAPAFAFDEAAPEGAAQGIFFPSRGLARLIRSGDLGSIDQSFSERSLAWNRGASQEDEGELKELYLDLELFDSRLWIRAGKQNIVWGKTELFRTTDQFNPQDLALASLPALEESRIALWSVRGIWSFYDVGPLEDVRLELAANYDQIEAADLGRCGEPYTIDLVCQGAFGLHVHGVLGLGLAGVESPRSPWDSLRGIEVGARVEWRWNRFSFALSDFYGYSDFPHVEQVFRFSRNVDPRTGRARHTTRSDPCVTGAEPACLVGVANPDDPNDPDDDPATPDVALPVGNALEYHSANQHIFAWICAMTIGVTPLDTSSCGNTIFNSRAPFGLAPLATLFGPGFAGNAGALGLLQLGLTDPDGLGGPQPAVPIPRVPLNRDPCDGVRNAAPDCDGPTTNSNFAAAGPTLNTALTVEQRALFGCGPYYDINCDFQGFDLLNAEASAIFQSWPGFEGTFFDWDAADPAVAQPGTEGFVGGPVCTRWEGGQLYVLPGCRGPSYQAGSTTGNVRIDRGVYEPLIDGCVRAEDGIPGNVDDACALSNGGAGARDLIHPFFDPTSPFFDPVGRGPSMLSQRFVNEMGALSFNALMFFVASSSPSFAKIPRPDLAFDATNPLLAGSDGIDNDFDDLVDEADESDPDHVGPYRLDGCSFRKPHRCFAVQGVIDFTRAQRSTVRAGGNGRFGRRDFVWDIGTPLVARFDKRNVLGFAMDWAEDVTKSNWNIEATWIEGQPFFDNDEVDGLREVDTYNLTVSVDRPTFINFLNQGRTIFFNSQWFFQYVDGYRKGFPSSGPWNTFFTFTATTGYFQDRMLPVVTVVYDFRSNSGALLPEVTYRFTENFSATFGFAGFWGRSEYRTTSVTQVGPSDPDRVGRHRDKNAVDNALSVIRQRDEVFLRVRYTF